MSDVWTDRLSEYIDATLSESERGKLDVHLSTCAECRTALDDLRRVVARARALDDRPPKADLWPAIAAQMGGTVVSLAARRERRRLSFTVPQLVAASVALAVVSGGGAWVLGGKGGPAPTTATATTPAVVMNVSSFATDPRYDAQVAALQRALDRGRSQLDTATVRVIEKNLKIIDRAIRDARTALAADPASPYLNLHLAHEMRRKLELMREAAALTGARS